MATGNLSQKATLHKVLTPYLKASKHTVSQLVDIAKVELRKAGFDPSLAGIEKEIRRSTRPIGHLKNSWGFRCLSQNNTGQGLFGCEFVNQGTPKTLKTVLASNKHHPYSAKWFPKKEADKKAQVKESK